MKGIHGLIAILIVLNLVLFPSVVAAEPAIPDNATVTSATLSVYISLVNGYPLNVHRITQDWTENGVTWGNFDSGYDPTVLASFTPVNSGWHTVDVTSVVQAWMNGTSPNYGFYFTQGVVAPDDTLYGGMVSSEYATVSERPKLEICYDQPGAENTCVTIQRPGSEPINVIDSYIYSSEPNTNHGTVTPLYIGNEPGWRKDALIRFYFSVFNVVEPSVSIIKYTNGVVADDPDGTEVPRITPGQPVTWTYEITNTGTVSVPAASVSVTDDQPGVTPEFLSVLVGNDDDMFDPDEVWLYQATGIAFDLTAPPSGVTTVQDSCTLGGTETPRPAYINVGTVTLLDVSDSAESSYCNPVVHPNSYYLPIISNNPLPIEPEVTPFRVTIGYEDLPLAMGQNDYDYNDWVVRIQAGATLDQANPDLWKRIRMNFEPGGRGATFTHSFHINFPANTFSSNGTATLITYAANSSVLDTQVFTFVASSDNDFTIFSNTGEVFPANFSNTVESAPRVAPQRTASLTIEFDQAIPFNLNNYNFTIPHGTGLFFDPYLQVRNTGDIVRRGDNRLLNVSEADRDYIWPEERVRIDRAYPGISFTNGIPPVIVFPDRWWINSNNCVIDGVICQ